MTEQRQKDAPHVPAAFINSIREEGNHEEACNFLQKVWNEFCEACAERDAAWNSP